MPDFRDTVRGILAMLLCCFSFIVNDTMVKAAGETLPLGQILFLRGLVATTLVGLVAWKLGAFHGWRTLFCRKIGLRTLGEVGATLLYLTALLHMPIANASAIAQAAPLVITAAGAVFLAEAVGWRRWSAVVVGFLGILLIVRPGTEGFNGYALLALASVFLVALRDVVTRFIPASTPTLFITVVTAAAVTVTGAGLSATEEWGAMGGREVALLLGAAVFVLLGYIFSVVAMRHGDVSIVAPFRYSFIPYAIAIGYIVWGDVPDGLTMVGIAIVVATGVYTFYRERRRAREEHRSEPTPLADPSVPLEPST